MPDLQVNVGSLIIWTAYRKHMNRKRCTGECELYGYGGAREAGVKQMGERGGRMMKPTDMMIHTHHR